MELEKAIEILKSFQDSLILTFKDDEELNETIDTVLNELDKEKLIKDMEKDLLKQAQLDVVIWKKLYEDLKEDFESYKKDKDINYLDGIHHKKLVEKSIGQIIENPEECWFDSIEVKIIRNNILYGIDIEKDFVTLKELADEHPEECFTVIAESPLSGAIYRYNNNNKHEWQLIGTMFGYA